MSLHHTGRLKSFRYALRGIREMLRTETNARIHAVATVAIVGLCFAIEIGRAEWLAIVLAIAGVWATEALNTAFEALCDAISPEYHPAVERAKDVAAGAVLIAALGASIVGICVLGPRLVDLVWS